MNWAWITGQMTEHEMRLEHGMELEKLKAESKGNLTGFNEAAAAGGGRIYPAHPAEGEKTSPILRLYGTIQDLNRGIKDWKGGA
jgi:hypothetical protein